jgi:TrkA domain protein
VGTAHGGITVEKAKLPGFGVRQEFDCAVGRRVGVITLKSGSRMLVVYDERDPDSAVASVELTDAEASLLAELLGAPGATERLARLQEQIEGILTANVGLGRAFAGRAMGDAQIRSRTGASIVAVFRDDEVVASPEPSFVLEAGDRVVVVGTDEGVSRAAKILSAD